MQSDAPPAIVSPAPAGPAVAAARPWNTAPWIAQHERNAALAAAGGLDAVFLGDSITEFFATRAPEVWSRFTAPYGSVANFGIAGDRTQFVLWRIEHGELDGAGARAVVLLIGTNNLESATADAVARGVAADVAAIRAHLPDAVVVLCALLPRGGPGDPLRAKAADVNARIAALADGAQVRWVDAGAGFLDPDDRIPAALMPDGLHPSPAGYEVWAAALRPVLDDVMKRPESASSGRSR